MKAKPKFNVSLLISFIILLLVLTYTGYILIYMNNKDNFLLLLINAIVLNLISVFAIINEYRQKVKKNPFNLANSLTAIVFAICTFLLISNTTTVALEDTVPNFVGKNISEVLKWGQENNVQIDQSYEFSDNYSEYIVFSQNILVGSLVKDITNMSVVVSSGYNYDKKIIIPSYVGQNIDDVISNLNNLHLNNVEITYEINDTIVKDTLISQSISGEVRRSDLIKMVVSLGNKDSLTDVTMIDLVGKTLNEAKLFLERNGLNYEVLEVFDESIINNVIKQSISEGAVIKPFSDKVTITVSKGNKISIPNLKDMSVDEVIKWISENNLKISFSDAYDNKIEAGKIISANYEENAIVEEGTTIKIVTSKGPLKMRKFSSLNEFRTWAENYNVLYEENYEFNTNISKGKIISFSLEENDLINIKEEIIVTISNGSPVTIPNFVGKTKSEISSSCNNLGLICTFSYSAYSTTSKDIALSQSKKASSIVVSGTSVIVYLSKGPAKTFTVELYESLLSLGNANATIKSLTSYFAKNYPDVTFNFSTKSSNEYKNEGFVHEGSPVKDGTKVTQGKSYNVIITK